MSIDSLADHSSKFETITRRVAINNHFKIRFYLENPTEQCLLVAIRTQTVADEVPVQENSDSSLNLGDLAKIVMIALLSCTTVGL